MALQVWLPLNGTLENKGLSNVSINDTGTTVNNNGKIGKCFKITVAKSLGYIPNFNTTGLSLCGWFKFNQSEINAITSTQTYDSTYNSCTGNLIGNNSYGGIGLIWQTNNIYSSGSLTSINIKSILRTSTAGSKSTTNFNIEFDKWIHITLTWDPNTHILSLYKDGVLFNSVSSVAAFTDGTSRVLSISHQGVWGGNARTPVIPIYENDIRVYDHCLSAKEIHEISKGLVLHYKLDNNGLGNINLLSPSVLDSSPAWKSALQGTEVYKEKEAVLIKTNTLYSKTSSGSTSVFPNISFKPNTQYTLSITWCDHLRTDSYSSSLYFRFKYDDGTLSSNLISPTANNNADWKHVSVTSAANKTVTMICTTYGRAGNVSIADIKLEEGNIDTGFSNTTDDDNSKIYDSSGYCNHGAILGNLNTSNDTSRYNYSSLFDGDTSCISVPYNSVCPSNIFTINLWFKKDAIGTKNYETLFGGPSGFEMDTRAGSTSTLSLYMTSTRGGNVFSPFTLGEWYMVTMTRNDTNEKYYINGELKKTIESKPMPNGSYFIGAWRTSTSQNYRGLISDFRIYSTVLTDEDILELYNTSAFVTNNGVFAEYELYEDNLSDVKKTGLLETGDFYENGADENHTLDTDKTRVASNYIISEEFIEI